jgi:hypothetical protein
MFGFIGGLKAAAWQVLAFLVAVFLIIGAFTWAFNNKNTATSVAGAVGNAAASVVIASADWVAKQAGGSAATAGEAATTGPEVIYVHNTAPNRWHVGAAIRVWNKGLTNVKLKAVQACPSDGTCFEVSQVSELPREDGRLVMGRTKTFLSKEILFNAQAVGQVDPSLYAVAACHELGHALGLDGRELGGTHGHSTSMKSCMHATVSAGVSTRPDKADYAAVNAKYGN